LSDYSDFLMKWTNRLHDCMILTLL